MYLIVKLFLVTVAETENRNKPYSISNMEPLYAKSVNKNNKNSNIYSIENINNKNLPVLLTSQHTKKFKEDYDRCEHIKYMFKNRLLNKTIPSEKMIDKPDDIYYRLKNKTKFLEQAFVRPTRDININNNIANGITYSTYDLLCYDSLYSSSIEECLIPSTNSTTSNETLKYIPPKIPKSLTTQPAGGGKKEENNF